MRRARHRPRDGTARARYGDGRGVACGDDSVSRGRDNPNARHVPRCRGRSSPRRRRASRSGGAASVVDALLYGGDRVSVQMTGLVELRAALRQLPAELADEANTYIDDTVEITAARLFQSYPKGDTGNLRAGIRKESHPSPFGGFGMVRSTSPPSPLWEFGTQSRKTSKGWSGGAAPSHKPEGVVRIGKAERGRLDPQVVELCRGEGCRVP